MQKSVKSPFVNQQLWRSKSGLKAFTVRAFFAIFKVHGIDRRADSLIRVVTLVNLFLKLAQYGGARSVRLVKWPFLDGLVWVNFNGDKLLFIVRKGLDFNIFLNPYFHEYDVTTLSWTLLRKNDAFVDVGAHAGLYTVLAGRRVGRDGLVISLEPNPEVAECLELNCRLNGLQMVKVIRQAAGSAEGNETFYYPAKEPAYASVLGRMQEGFTSSFEATTTTLDEVYRACLAPRTVRMLKVDTEGYDLEVLKGAERMLPHVEFVVIEQHSTEVKDFMKLRGFAALTLRPSGYLLCVSLRSA